MKLILCTLLGFGVAVVGFGLLLSVAYIVGIVPYRLLEKEWPWWKRGETPAAIFLGLATAIASTIFYLLISISYLIGKGICQ